MKAGLRGLLLAGLSFLGLGATDPPPFDESAMKVMPLMEVIQLATESYSVRYAGDRLDAELKRIATLDPKVQTLVWLATLDEGLSPQTEENHDMPSAFIGEARFHDRLEHALVEAGLGVQAAAFANAMQAQGPSESLGLGAAFGTKAAFETAIEGYARDNGSVADWCEAARAKFSDGERLRALIDMLGRWDARDWLRAWPAPYRIIVLADFLDREVGNGGAAQYFYNSSGELAPATIDAMRDLGLPTQAGAIERGVAMFPQPYPIDTEERRKVLDNGKSAGLEDRLDTLTNVIGYDAVRPAMIIYAKRHALLPR